MDEQGRGSCARQYVRTREKNTVQSHSAQSLKMSGRRNRLGKGGSLGLWGREEARGTKGATLAETGRVTGTGRAAPRLYLRYLYLHLLGPQISGVVPTERRET